MQQQFFSHQRAQYQNQMHQPPHLYHYAQNEHAPSEQVMGYGHVVYSGHGYEMMGYNPVEYAHTEGVAVGGGTSVPSSGFGWY